MIDISLLTGDIKEIICNIIAKYSVECSCEHFMRMIENSGRRYTLLAGGAGTGKSTLIKAFIKHMEERGKKCLVCSTTGSSAVLIKGRTIHKALGISAVDLELKRFSRSKLSREFEEASYIIIEEASMLVKDLVDIINKAVEGTDKKIILVGDLAQLPPVHKKKKLCKGDRLMMQLFMVIGEQMDVMLLTENRRQGEDRQFADVLNRITVEGYFEGINDYFSTDFYYGDRKRAEIIKRKIADILIEAAKNMENVPYICSYKKQCKDMNSFIIKNFGEAKSWTYSVYTGAHDRLDSLSETQRKDVEKKVKQKKSEKKDENSYSCEEVTLYNGEKVMLTVNKSDSSSLELANGTLGTVIALFDDHVDVKIWPIESGMESKIVSVYPIEERHYVYYKGSDGVKKAFCYEACTYMPLACAYAITAHKAQGITVSRAFIDPKGAFEEGMLYVMLSRVRSMDGVYLVNPIKPEDVQISEYAYQYYAFIMCTGRSYDDMELRILADGGEILEDGYACTPDDIAYLTEKAAAIDEYKRYERVVGYFKEKSLEAYAPKCWYDLRYVDDIEGLIDRIIFFNVRSRHKDPRLLAAIIEGLRRGEEPFMKRAEAGEFHEYYDQEGRDPVLHRRDSWVYMPDDNNEVIVDINMVSERCKKEVAEAAVVAAENCSYVEDEDLFKYEVCGSIQEFITSRHEQAKRENELER